MGWTFQFSAALGVSADFYVSVDCLSFGIVAAPRHTVLVVRGVAKSRQASLWCRPGIGSDVSGGGPLQDDPGAVGKQPVPGRGYHTTPGWRHDNCRHGHGCLQLHQNAVRPAYCRLSFLSCPVNFWSVGMLRLLMCSGPCIVLKARHPEFRLRSAHCKAVLQLRALHR